MKYIALVFCLFISATAMAQPHQHPQENNHHHGVHTSAIGIHGMALFAVDGQFFASHMPLANSIHSHQIIFSIEVNPTALEQMQKLEREQTLLSIVPERFDLVALMQGKLTEFKADVYRGHFERQGKKQLTEVVIKVDKILLSESLSHKENGFFYHIPLNSRYALAVHRISQLPSYDQILLLQNSEKLAKENLSNTRLQLIPLADQQPYSPQKHHPQLPKGYTIKKQLYLETQDFQVR